MAVHTYSTYEAKARFSEVLKKVREGHRVIITYRGKEIAELRAIVRGRVPVLEERLAELEAAGEIRRPRKRFSAETGSLAKKPGALARFLESRD
ncbi:MAG: type II toxin-antitoxin system prevent-host-death family antitoxin [Planctomycetes bacterium]|nr:type II toxin-antitoxin system prevent-host-death family antitoxin [Planctomycetota bacterium]